MINIQQSPDATMTALPYRSQPEVEITEGPHNLEFRLSRNNERYGIAIVFPGRNGGIGGGACVAHTPTYTPTLLRKHLF